MALKGNLKDFSTTQLLNLIHLARKTGALTIQVPSGVTTLFFREGKLVYTTMSGRDGHLASVLSRAGKLSEEHAKIELRHTRIMWVDSKVIAHLAIGDQPVCRNH